MGITFKVNASCYYYHYLQPYYDSLLLKHPPLKKTIEITRSEPPIRLQRSQISQSLKRARKLGFHDERKNKQTAKNLMFCFPFYFIFLISKVIGFNQNTVWVKEWKEKKEKKRRIIIITSHNNINNKNKK